jgi:mRNA interferase MazF
VPNINRGEVWLIDLGLAAKVRPGLVPSVAPINQERVLVTLVPHTTSLRGTRFEIVVPKPFLKTGAFDCQASSRFHQRASSEGSGNWRIPS